MANLYTSLFVLVTFSTQNRKSVLTSAPGTEVPG